MEIKFFYDHFTDAEVGGLFTPTHFIYLVCFFAVLALLLWLSRGVGDVGLRRINLIIAISSLVMEVAKISIRIYKNQAPDSWVPLYYCSLFLLAVWLPFIKNKFIPNIGYSYMTLGGIAGALLFTLYPSTSLGIFPVWHPASIHSAVYHLMMIYLGIMLLWKGRYKPEWSHLPNYFLLIFAASVPAVVLNELYGTNCMFLRHAFKLPILEWMIDISPYFYMAVVFLGQAVLVFLAACGIYKLVAKGLKRKDNLRCGRLPI